MELSQFGGRLRRIREAAGLTQEEVVARLGKKDTGAISEYENGKRRLYAYEVDDYARALGVSVAEIFEDFLPADDLDLALLDWFRRLPRDKKRRIYNYIINSVPYIIGDESDRHTLNDEGGAYPARKRSKV